MDYLYGGAVHRRRRPLHCRGTTYRCGNVCIPRIRMCYKRPGQTHYRSSGGKVYRVGATRGRALRVIAVRPQLVRRRRALAYRSARTRVSHRRLGLY